MRNLSLVCLFFSTLAFAAEPAKKIVLIAGPLDKSHPPGTHEYEKTVRAFKYCLEHARNVNDLRVEAYFDGWPSKPETLDDADTIVLVASGSDRKETDHLFLVGDRLSVIEKQMKRGCGLCLIHWCTFWPKEKAGDKVLDWVGGYFDYESGPAKNGWYSKIQTVTVKCVPGKHAITTGMSPFEAKDEFYYNIRFRERDPRLVPILTVPIEGEQTVAWAVDNGEPGRVSAGSKGRGFGFTGGHFFDNWKNDNYRKMALNAILWTAKMPVPDGGVKSEFPPDRELIRDIKGDPLWTPPTPANAKEPWELATDKDWIDGRIRKMDTGPSLNATIDYEGPKGKVRSYKGTAIKVGDKGEATVLFDRNSLRFAAAWTGGFLNHSDRRFGLLNTPTPNGTMVFSTSSLAGWADEKGNFESKYPPTGPLPKEWGRFNGMYVNGNRTVLNYTVGGVRIAETIWVEPGDGKVAIIRSFDVAPHKSDLRCLVADAPVGTRIERQNMSELMLCRDRVHTLLSVSSEACFWSFETKEAKTEGDRQVYLDLLPSDRNSRVFIAMLPGKDERWTEGSPVLSRAKKVETSGFTKPGPARWTKPITTRLEPGKDTGGPFAVDTFPLPYDNPYNALFFVTGVDFLPDGRIAICTAHGDVWTAKEKDGTITWHRFATGLYQPLGLKVVDGKIIVTERGQLTRLHDTNNDGEADFYECLNNDWHTGNGEHSYDTCLETDPEGNFYLFKTGDPETPTGGCLLKISKDGFKSEIFATGFRHPIGLGVSPEGKIFGADQEGNWMPMTRIDQYKKGGFYGDMRTHHRDVPPKIYDEPLLWLPKEADNSAGGQVWVPKGEWGSLAGHMLHLSYGRCKAYAILPDGDKFQAGAVDLGLTFLSGSARARFNPVDKNMYVVGLNGWQTAAKKDGCLQRVRYTGKPFPFACGFATDKDGVRLNFDQPLDPKIAADLSKYKIGRCNYHWSGEYGSKNWSVLDPNKEGIDDVPVTAATLSENRKTVTLKCDMRPAMHMKIAYDLQSANGAKLTGAVYTTIHKD
jgi:type 1 glutamine amidotransferase